MEQLIDIVLLSLLVVTAVAALRLRDLFAVAMMFGIYSLLIASLFATLDAVDVALTEAAVGAGVSTVLMIAALSLTDRKENRPQHPKILPIAVVLITGAALIYGTLDMPQFGDPEAPVHQHVAPRYIEESPKEIGIPNMVASVLASYRGYDTFGEVVVVFTAAVGVLLLLRGRRRRPDEDETEGEGR